MNTTSLRFRLEIDRDFLCDILEYYRIILPIIDTLTLHPTMLLLLLKNSKVMASDIRLGYFLNEVALIAFDWIFNFSLRMYPIQPYSAFYCGGPACKLIESRWAIMLILSCIITANIPCNLFLTMRMHRNTSGGLRSTLNITNRWTAIMMFIHISTMGVNIWGFLMFAVESDDAAIIANEPELRWFVERGGKLFVFGKFGESQHFRYELWILAASIVSNAPVLVITTFDAVINLRSIKSAAVSNKTAKMTQQLLSLFIAQHNGAMLSMVVPLTVLFLPMFLDLHQLPGFVLLTMRIFVTVFLTGDPFQFPLIFLWKCSGKYKENLVARLRQLFRRGTGERSERVLRSRAQNAGLRIFISHTFSPVRWTRECLNEETATSIVNSTRNTDARCNTHSKSIYCGIQQWLKDIRLESS